MNLYKVMAVRRAYTYITVEVAAASIKEAKEIVEASPSEDIFGPDTVEDYLQEEILEIKQVGLSDCLKPCIWPSELTDGFIPSKPQLNVSRRDKTRRTL